MKKSVILTLAAMLCAATLSFSQTTTGSVDQPASQHKQNQGAQQHKGDQTSQPGEPSKQHPGTEALDQDKTSKNNTQPANQVSPGAAAQSPVKNDAVKTSDRPGGATHENANDVGKYSESENSKSLLNSKEAIAERRRNRTESDTTLKKGSGSAPKNMKNHTGKTGNFKNGATKHNEPK